MTNGIVDMMTDKNEVEVVRDLLRSVRYPGFQRDIVGAGFVKDIDVSENTVTVHFAPDTRDQSKIEQMEAGIREVLSLSGNFKRTDIQRHQPFPDADVLSEGGGRTPLQAEMLQDGVVPEADIVGREMRRADMALDAGYDEDGVQPLGGPRSEVYEGELPVLQWEIDPHNPDAESGTANLVIDDWDFRLWWQVHPRGLVYASIQAMQEDWVEHDGAARSHPVGRSEAVNLAYDAERKAVVAIYGTVQDFRPFVDAFYRGYVLKN